MPGVMIAGTHSGSGKTTVTMALLAAFAGLGKSVQAFKAGPDFIDTGLHRMITGRPARNLDSWMCGEQYVRDCFARHSATADLSLVEGVMGLYDGDYSSARLALLLDLPVILVIDAYGMAESAGAIAQGFLRLLPETKGQSSARPQIAGVIFNRVATERHLSRLRQNLGDIPVYGYLPRDVDFAIPHRHLGLTVAQENPLEPGSLEKLARVATTYIDLEGITALAGTAFGPGKRPARPAAQDRSKVRIAYACDRAFCFYYEDNLELLAASGAELVPFSPLGDSALPERVDALYLGGGYPELYAGRLAENRTLKEEVHRLAAAGMPIYAECGGLIYLSRGIHDLEGQFHLLAGVLPFTTRMRKRLVHLGYREITLREDCLLGPRGAKLRGHEFHYSEIVDDRETAAAAFTTVNNRNEICNADGFRRGGVLASYIHIHFASCPSAAENFVKHIREWKWKQSS